MDFLIWLSMDFLVFRLNAAQRPSKGSEETRPENFILAIKADVQS